MWSSLGHLVGSDDIEELLLPVMSTDQRSQGAPKYENRLNNDVSGCTVDYAIDVVA